MDEYSVTWGEGAAEGKSGSKTRVPHPPLVRSHQTPAVDCAGGRLLRPPFIYSGKKPSNRWTFNSQTTNIAQIQQAVSANKYKRKHKNIKQLLLSPIANKHTAANTLQNSENGVLGEPCIGVFYRKPRRHSSELKADKEQRRA